MKHSKLWTGLSSVVAILLVVAILATQCMLGYSATINDMLGITTSEIVSNSDSDEDTTYYESAYGELNYDNLQQLIADTYSHADTEECLYLGFELTWMPGSNVHRTPFGGRNFEYYSEDFTVGYICAAIEVEAMESKGVHAGMKHFAGNDQENNSEGIAVFFNEQTFREGALRVFEKAVSESGCTAICTDLTVLASPGAPPAPLC